ncbi:MAG TPA: carboxypeptidase-like regulatory domain-containing protein [Thermoanaerobaculia bacterium]|nr:carboxypeptidase-like regulatory domain-containing protein [Thermoanaerobaculia bacterium]
MFGPIARIAVFVAVVAHAAAASEVRVSFSTPLDPTPIEGEVRLHARSDGGAEKDATVRLVAGGSIVLDEGLWELTATSSRYWMRPATLNVGADATTISLTAFRTVAVRGQVSAPVVNELTIGFAPPPADPPSPIPASTVTCPIEKQKFACQVPEGLLDLTFRAPGYVALYRWNEKVSADRDVGLLTLRKGSSFTGTVLFAERQPKNAPAITVAVWSTSAAAQNDVEKARTAIARQSATPNARGFFQFALAPGNYVVQATAVGGLTSEKRDLRVLDGRESRLRAPLVLERPHALTVRVDPPAGPYGKPWQLSLTTADRNGGVEFEANAEVSPNGEWRREGLYAGHYTLSIRRTEEDAWFSAPVDVTNADVDVDAKVPLTHLRGNVTYAGKPLVANVWFSDAAGKRVGIRSRADGTYGPILFPQVEGDTWPRVEVEAESPYVRRTLRNVKLKQHDDDREVDIEVKGATIFGDVVDEKGVPQANALVTATMPDRTVVQVESASGSFVINGVQPGHVNLRANAKMAETSGPTELEITGEESTEANLVVKPGVVVEGVVRSVNGGVSDVGIASVPLNHHIDYVSQQPADPEGKFRIFLPPDSTAVLVSVNAPGYAYRLLRMPARTDTPMPVFVETSGGALTLAAPDAVNGAIPYVIHGGALLPMHIVLSLSGAETDTIPMAEEGAYALCVLAPGEIVAAADGFRPPGRCATGLLPRGGALTLEAPSSHAARAQ